MCRAKRRGYKRVNIKHNALSAQNYTVLKMTGAGNEEAKISVNVSESTERMPHNVMAVAVDGKTRPSSGCFIVVISLIFVSMSVPVNASENTQILCGS